MAIIVLGIVLLVLLAVLAYRWASPQYEFDSMMLHIVFNAGILIIAITAYHKGWPVTRHIAVGFILLAVLLCCGAKLAKCEKPMLFSGVTTIIGVVASMCVVASEYDQYNKRQVDEQLKKQSEEARENRRVHREKLRKAAEEPADLKTLKRYAVFHVFDRFAEDGKYAVQVSASGTTELVYLGVTKDVHDVLRLGHTLQEQMMAIETALDAPEALPNKEGARVPKLRKPQLATTNGVVLDKLGDLGQRILIIEMNGKRVCFAADDDVFNAVEPGTRLPLPGK
jgi:hypothetical protein